MLIRFAALFIIIAVVSLAVIGLVNYKGEGLLPVEQSQKCAVTNCHGTEVTCGVTESVMCTADYQLGDRCRQFAKCEISDNSCQLKVDPKFNSCLSCVAKCKEQNSNDLPNLFSCESSCGEESVDAVSENSVSFAKQDGVLYLKYHNNIYRSGKENHNGEYVDPIKVPIKDKLDWTPLVSRPSQTDQMSDNVSGFETFPDNASFVFIMSWATPNDPSYGGQFKTYYYDGKIGLKGPIELAVDKAKSVPKIDKVSPDGKYVSFTMFGCWGCEDTQPEKLLLRVADQAIKRIGQVSYFNWKENGNYDYKDYQSYDCGSQIGLPCSVSPDKLPLKSASF